MIQNVMFINIHAKEMKTKAGLQFQSEYVIWCREHLPTKLLGKIWGGTIVVTTDANTASPEMVKHFKGQITGTMWCARTEKSSCRSS